MNRNITYGLLVLALLGLAGAGVVTAHGLGGHGNWRVAGARCADDMTMGDCRELHQSAREDKLLERCNERYDGEFCATRAGLHSTHKAEMDQLYEEHGVEAPPQAWFMGHRGRAVDLHPAAAPCTDDQTVKDCREAHRGAVDKALVAACSETHGEDFCHAWQDLRADHRVEQQALLDEYGIEKPLRHPHHFGHRVPFGRVH